MMIDEASRKINYLQYIFPFPLADLAASGLCD